MEIDCRYHKAENCLGKAAWPEDAPKPTRKGYLLSGYLLLTRGSALSPMVCCVNCLPALEASDPRPHPFAHRFRRLLDDEVESLPDPWELEGDNGEPADSEP